MQSVCKNKVENPTMIGKLENILLETSFNSPSQQCRFVLFWKLWISRYGWGAINSKHTLYGSHGRFSGPVAHEKHNHHLSLGWLEALVLMYTILHEVARHRYCIYSDLLWATTKVVILFCQIPPVLQWIDWFWIAEVSIFFNGKWHAEKEKVEFRKWLYFTLE